jgi:hypothetical protein
LHLLLDLGLFTGGVVGSSVAASCPS